MLILYVLQSCKCLILRQEADSLHKRENITMSAIQREPWRRLKFPEYTGPIDKTNPKMDKKVESPEMQTFESIMPEKGEKNGLTINDVTRLVKKDRNTGKISDLFRPSGETKSRVKINDSGELEKIKLTNDQIKKNQLRIKLLRESLVPMKSVEKFEESVDAPPPKIRLAMIGYSAPPNEDYAKDTQEFLDTLADKIGATPDKLGVITSPTASVGSVDALSTELAHKKDLPLMYITAERYAKYIDPKALPKENIDIDKYIKEPKYILPDEEQYSQAIAKMSNVTLACGGREITIQHVKDSIEQDSQVILLRNKKLGEVWKLKENKETGETEKVLENGTGYLIETIEAFNKGEKLPHSDIRGFSEFLKANKAKIEKNVKIFDIEDINDSDKSKELIKFVKKAKDKTRLAKKIRSSISKLSTMLNRN